MRFSIESNVRPPRGPLLCPSVAAQINNNDNDNYNDDHDEVFNENSNNNSNNSGPLSQVGGSSRAEQRSDFWARFSQNMVAHHIVG